MYVCMQVCMYACMHACMPVVYLLYTVYIRYCLPVCSILCVD